MPTRAGVPRIGYLRLLSLLLLYLPTEHTYTADAGRWSEAIKWLRDTYDDEWPDLFVDLTFSVRPSARPYSSQVSEFLTRAQLGNIVEVMNPGYTRLKIHKEARQTLEKEYESRVDEDIRVIIRKLADQLLSKKRNLLLIEE